MRQFFASILILTCLVSLGQTTEINELWKSYNSKDFKLVIEKAKALLEIEPNNIELNLMIGRSFADLADYENAVPFLKQTIKNDKYNAWQKAWALNYLGTCYFMLQNYEDSEEALNACIKLNATKNATNDAYGKTLFFGFHNFYKSWKIIETEEFRFHFQNMDELKIENYTSVREKAFKEINDFFKSSLPKKIDFYVWESREDAKRILRKNLGFANPNFCIVHSHSHQTIGHEMTHVISNYTSVINIKTRFINEGTSVCFDLSNNDKLKKVKDWIAKNNKQIGIKDYWENGDKYAEEILYPLSGLFVKELIDNFGKEKFLEFFKDQTYEHARIVFGDNLNKVIQEFEIRINS